MAENCTLVESLGTEICTFQLQGLNQIVGNEQKMFVVDSNSVESCSSGGGSSDSVVEDLQRQISILEVGITQAEATLEESQSMYNEFNSAVAYVNSLIEDWGSMSNWLTSQIASYEDQLAAGTIDNETYQFWVSSYVSQNNYVIAQILSIMNEYDYSFLVQKRDELYEIVSEAFYILYYFNGNPTNSMLIEDLEDEIEEAQANVSPIEVDLRCVLDKASTPITLFGARSMAVGSNIILDVEYGTQKYDVPFRIVDIEPTIINIMSRDEELDILHGEFGVDTNLFDYLSAIDPSLANLNYNQASKLVVTINIKE